MKKENILSKISKMSVEELIDLARSTSDAEILNMLAINANYEVRCTVAANKNTSADTLDILAKDKDDDVRLAVANNPNTSYNTLIMLIKDKSVYISKTAEYTLKECKEKSKTSIER